MFPWGTKKDLSGTHPVGYQKYLIQVKGYTSSGVLKSTFQVTGYTILWGGGYLCVPFLRLIEPLS